MSTYEHFRAAYASGASPPWDIGRAQPALVQAQKRGLIRGLVLDVGCGTGENALFFAASGSTVVGVDVVPAAIERAAAKAAARGLGARTEFIVADVLEQLGTLGERRFDTVVDMGFFHTLSDGERVLWRDILARLLAPGGSYVMICFSELVPGTAGPRRVSEREIRDVFTAVAGFRVVLLERTTIESKREAGAQGVPAWLATIERAGS